MKDHVHLAKAQHQTPESKEQNCLGTTPADEEPDAGHQTADMKQSAKERPSQDNASLTD